MLITEYCKECQCNTDHELNTVSLSTECLTCGCEENVTESYVHHMCAAE